MAVNSFLFLSLFMLKSEAVRHEIGSTLAKKLGASIRKLKKTSSAVTLSLRKPDTRFETVINNINAKTDAIKALNHSIRMRFLRIIELL
tara:strand:+ start:1001 stop:1267 length:267 start_codon:yes stop_codon:yes gene_type:complete